MAVRFKREGLGLSETNRKKSGIKIEQYTLKLAVCIIFKVHLHKNLHLNSSIINYYY